MKHEAMPLVAIRPWLATSRRGDTICYWIGSLPKDRPGNRLLFHVSTALFRLSEASVLRKINAYQARNDECGAGCVALFQKRNYFGDGFDYIARIIKQPTFEELEVAFRWRE